MKNLRIFMSVTLTVLIGAGFYACKKDDVFSDNYQRRHSKICYATEKELTQFDNDREIIHYKVARYVAYEEIENCLSEFMELDKGSYRLTDLPVIIWDYDSRPKYYEFGIIVDGQLVKTITTLAKKEATNMCCFMFNEVIEHPEIGGYKFFAGNYPNVFYGMPSNPGSSPSFLLDETGENTFADIPSCDILENYTRLIESMDDESRENHQTAIENMKNEIAEFNQGLAVFWSELDAIKDEILEMTDEDILAKFQTKSLKANLSDIYKIPQYDNPKLMLTRWRGWCGPSAISWIYRGLYSFYPKSNTSNRIRIKGDGSYNSFYDGATAYYDFWDDALVPTTSPKTDHGLYLRLRQECVKTGISYPMYQAGMNRGMKAITDNRYGIDLTLAPHNRIRVNKLPVINMFGYSWSFHYVAAFGSGYEKKNGRIKSKWLLVTDNGTRISAHGYAPYWRSQSPDPGIHYRVH